MANPAFLFFSIDTLNHVFLPKFMHVVGTGGRYYPHLIWRGQNHLRRMRYKSTLKEKQKIKKYVMHTSQSLFFSFWEKQSFASQSRILNLFGLVTISSLFYILHPPKPKLSTTQIRKYIIHFQVKKLSTTERLLLMLF